jgi:predicted phosphodiesterase
LLPAISAERFSTNSHLYRIKSGEIKLLLISDIHFDSPNCDRDTLSAHLDQAKADGALVIINGDLFDVMGAYRDPRSKPNEVRPEYYVRGKSYLDAVLEDVVSYFRPYRDNLLQVNTGNHESSVQKHHDTDIIDRFIFMMNLDNALRPVQRGAYQGYINLMLHTAGTMKSSYKIAYNHGSGGGARRSKDILKADLDFARFRNANLIMSGHTHDKLHYPGLVGYELDPKGRVRQVSTDWIKTGSYKKTSADYGWEVEKGFNPSKMGGYWCHLEQKRVRSTDPGGEERAAIYIDATFTEAKPVYR